MKWILQCMKEEYGARRWNKMSEYDQLTAIAAFGCDLKAAIININKYRHGRNKTQKG